MGLVINNLSKSYRGSKLSQPMEILHSLDLNIESGTFVSLIGPSGCGKSTICNLVAGIELPDNGEILLDGKIINGIPGQVSYMPQKDLLLPWRTLLNNVILGCEILGKDKRQAREEAQKWLDQFGLAAFSGYYPHQLSGGMRQRGALLRTILFGRKTLLLDEPFGALDALTRKEMQRWLLMIWNQTHHTVLFITHDIDEAILLSDKVVVLSQRPARILQEFSIPFAHPRDPDLLLSNEALALKKQLLQLLLH
ncbi:MAG TPA: ABC transporter ATP-binding protein [Desulfitobacteriaceae bacterium]|nr:ABC transporter ATP-binding protein [Desulfitobacteriaceae bacterium]